MAIFLIQSDKKNVKNDESGPMGHLCPFKWDWAVKNDFVKDVAFCSTAGSRPKQDAPPLLSGHHPLVIFAPTSCISLGSTHDLIGDSGVGVTARWWGAMSLLTVYSTRPHCYLFFLS